MEACLPYERIARICFSKERSAKTGSVPPRGSGWVVLTTPFLTDAFGFANIAISSPMWNDTDTPLAYFISFRTYGTWLHGDERGSIDRFHNHYRSPYLAPNERWRRHTQRQLKAPPLILSMRQRESIEAAIRETCYLRKWSLLAINVRTNHVHTVVKANRLPGLVLNAFKANATRKLRTEALWSHLFSPWADKGSKRRLWNDRSVARAIDYVINGQNDAFPDFDE